MIKILVILAILPGAIWNSAATAAEAPHDWTIAEALQAAENASPALKASHARITQAKAGLESARSYFYPSLEVSAVDSVGFPGSSTPTPLEFGGILNSPFRVGPAVGLVGKLTLFDLGNWYRVDASGEDLRSREDGARLTRVRLDQEALEAYLTAARWRGAAAVWNEIEAKIEAVEKTVRGFVKTGQYSDVSRLLIQDQVDEAKMNRLTLEERYRQARKRLALLLGRTEEGIDCPRAFALSEADLSFLQPSENSPLVATAEAEARGAQARASQAASGHLPKLYAVGSAGFLNDARLVEKQGYSAWVGVTVPIFEGFRISAETQRARAITEEKENLLEESRLQLAELNIGFNETIEVSRTQLTLLARQRENAVRAFDLARQRYLSFLGPVVDLREALRNLVRIESQINDYRANVMLALGSMALLNGALAHSHL